MKKTLLSSLIAASLVSLPVSAEVTEATLYPNGGVLTWSETAMLQPGSHSITVSGLPAEISEETIQAALMGVPGATIRQVTTTKEEHEDVVSEELAELLGQKAALLASITLIDYKIDVADNQIMLTTQVASNPGEQVAEKEVKALSESLKDIRLEAYLDKHRLSADRGELEEQLAVIDRKIGGISPVSKTTKAVKIDYVSEASGEAKLDLRFQLPTVGWKSGYNARLDTTNSTVAIEHKALIRQQTGIDWKGVNLTLSMMRPSHGASLPAPSSWNVRRVTSQPNAEVMSFSAAKKAMRDTAVRGPVPVANLANNGSRTQSYQVSGQVDLDSKAQHHVMVIDEHAMDADLKTHFMPHQSNQGYLVAHATYEGKVSLPAARVTVYRDGDMLGPWLMPEMKPGSKVQVGFGVDDRVSLEKITERNTRGVDGIVKKENTWERLNRYEITNRHDRSVDVRVIERLPVSRHDDIKVTHYNLSTPLINNYENLEGVIAWDRTLASGAGVSLTAGFEIKVPYDQDI